LILFLLVGLAAVLCLVPYPLKLEVKGQLVPITRRYTFAGDEGTVETIFSKPGQDMGVEQPMLQLHNLKVDRQISQIDAFLKIKKAQVQSLLEQQNAPENRNNPAKQFELKNHLFEVQREVREKEEERAGLVKGLRTDEKKPGRFLVLAPAFDDEENNRRRKYLARLSPEELARRDAHLRELNLPPDSGIWTVLSNQYQESLIGKTVDPSTPLIRIGDKDSGWEVEMKVPQKNINHIRAAYGYLETDVLEVDLLVRSEPTKTYRGLLYKSRIGGEATPQKDDNNENEPVVTAYVTIDDDDIPEDKRIPRDLCVTGVEVLGKVRCGDHALGYSLFYGVWEFFCEKVLFSF
jgi:hypothetical protein